MAVLLSPVAWIHHFHWIVVVVFAVLGADPWRDRRRLVSAGAITAAFLCRMPDWGIAWLSHPELPAWPGRVLQNSDTFFTLGALALLWWTLHLKPATRHTDSVETPDARVMSRARPRSEAH
jgi:alpha-1,2-mannosyltransferase